MQLTLSQKLYLSAAGALVMLVALALVNLLGSRQANEDMKEVIQHEVKSLLKVQAIDRDLLEIRFRIAGVVLDQLPSVGSQNHLKEARATIEKNWREFESANTADSSNESELVAQVGAGMKILPAMFDKINALYSANDNKALTAFLEDEWPIIITKVQKPLSQLVKIHDEKLAERQESSLKAGQRRVTMSIIISVIAATVMLVFTALVIRSIRRPIDDIRQVLTAVSGNDFSIRAKKVADDEIGGMADAVNQTLDALRGSLTEVSQAAERISRGSAALSSESAEARAQTETLTDKVMQVSAAMEQLTVSISEISERAGAVASASTAARKVAHDGERLVASNVASTRGALTAVTSTSAVVSELSKSIDKISEVTAVIKEIADQTNLLALNAAIEAARAGEQGRGFAVVADEVRKLAERTTNSTTDIAQMIQAVQGKTGDAVSAMTNVSRDVETGAAQAEQLSSSFQSIVAATDQLMQLSEEIADGSREQSHVAQQVAQSMETISGAGERTNHAVSVVANTAKESAQTADHLKQVVNRFRLG
jgi:methyl-accepting chemotaxis protein